ncbi:D-hexose-6-phosphate mutarotase [Diaphorobacter ruginosibacter]|uniref:D-hexose-6-phosphate mutarotase n=1 Tax=Diaphorobacter ruginosibacter TaxID=1715720 RepID=UPI00333F99D9
MSVSIESCASRVRGETLHGQPVVRLSLPCGDSALVALHGAQVISWHTPSGGEHLFLSDRAVWNGRDAVRGGVPICFPQFNQRGPLAKHGFARNLPWRLLDSVVEVDGVTATLALRDDETTRAWWPHGFDARLVLSLRAGVLRMALELENTGKDSWSFTGALHTYLRVPGIDGMQLDGLSGLARWDAVRDLHGLQRGTVRFDGEYDSVFAPAAAPLRLRDSAARRSMIIENSAGWGNVVVWNPGAALCAKLEDMPAQGYRHMLCVEAACVDRPVMLEPGQRWSGWQQLTQWRAQAH